MSSSDRGRPHRAAPPGTASFSEVRPLSGNSTKGAEAPFWTFQGDWVLRERGKFEIPLSLSGSLVTFCPHRKSLARRRNISQRSRTCSGGRVRTPAPTSSRGRCLIGTRAATWGRPYERISNPARGRTVCAPTEKPETRQVLRNLCAKPFDTNPQPQMTRRKREWQADRQQITS